ncbi:MAG: hypothetical protein U0223_12985 [Nitrospira sp.]|nr:hypothetical protein [Nitrospira sp.]
MRYAASVIHHAEVLILAAAVALRVNYLITWNTRHFHKVSDRKFAPFPVVTPVEFLVVFCRALLKE